MSLNVVIGVTGNVGRAAARKLLAKGVQVRGVIRNQTKAAGLVEDRIEPAVAELDDARALTAAFEGADGVYVMTPYWFDAADMFAENVRAVAAIGKALRAAKPSRIVLLSSIGAGKPSGTGAIAKLHHLERSFADLPGVVSIRAGWFMENFAGLIPHVRETGVLPSMFDPLEGAHPMVATQDIGDVVAETLLRGGDFGGIVNLEGPRRYAPTDVAATLAKVLARPVRAEELARARWASTYAQWGLSPRSAEAMIEMMEGFNSGHIAFEEPEAETRHGPTTLEVVLAKLSGG